MSKRIQLRRGTATENNAFTGANGEVTVDTTNKTLRVHDGVTAGGTPLARLEEATLTKTGLIQIATEAEVNAVSGLYKAVTPYTMHAGIKYHLNASGNAPIYACRAWVNFNGTGTVAIRASGNVSSITDNGTGDYTINLSTPMADESYATLVTGGKDNAAHLYVNLLTTSTVRVLRGVTGTVPAGDVEVVNVAIFR